MSTGTDAMDAQVAEPTQQQDRRGYKEYVRENKLFDEYYRAQGIVPEPEWNAFRDALARPLPSTFRFATNPTALATCAAVAHAACRLRSNNSCENDDAWDDDDGDARKTLLRAVGPDLLKDGVLRPLAWHPNQSAWRCDASRTEIRKSEPLQRLHKFLVSESDVGLIARQEEVSMLPATLLDVKPGMRVLDMCAAPGSKTAQIIDALFETSKSETGSLLVANDAVLHRAHTLVHQVKPLQSSSLVVTAHDARHFPSLFQKIEIPNSSLTKKGEQIYFDRVLADVPCSGDGTLRKMPAMWSTWTVQQGIGLHRMQLQILMRALQLARPEGSRIVYSTCTMNPLENEAVVAAALIKCRGSVRLVSADIKNFATRPGLTSWKVPVQNSADKSITYFSTYIELKEHDDNQAKRKLFESMFPPVLNQEAQKGLPSLEELKKCIRVYPHLQDSGAFFVAVLEKTAPLVSPNTAFAAPVVEESISVAEIPKNDAGMVKEAVPSAGATRIRVALENRLRPGYIEEPFYFLTKEDEDMKAITTKFNLKPGFPVNQLIVRTESDRNRAIYYVDQKVKEYLCAAHADKLRVVTSGVKLFARCSKSKIKRQREALDGLNNENNCEFRLHGDGLPMLSSQIDANIIEITDAKDLHLLLQNDYTSKKDFTDEFQRNLERHFKDQNGAVACFYKTKSKKKPLMEAKIAWFAAWNGKSTFGLLLNKRVRTCLYDRVKMLVSRPIEPVIESKAPAQASSAVLVQSDTITGFQVARGPNFEANNSLVQGAQALIASYASMGFQGTNLARAIDIINLMLESRTNKSENNDEKAAKSCTCYGNCDCNDNYSADNETEEEDDDEKEEDKQESDAAKLAGMLDESRNNWSKDKLVQAAQRMKGKGSCKIFLGYTSNMMSSGLREIFCYLAKHKLVDVIVTTGGGIEEDFIKCLADTFVADFRVASGSELRSRGVNRIGNLLVPNDNYCKFENWVVPLLRECTAEQNTANAAWTPSKLIDRLGERINNESSVYYWCHKNKIPVYCPAITDGSLGDMIYFESYRQPEGQRLRLDVAADIRSINDEALHAKHTGVVILGGGLVKHHICNANLMRNGADYAVFVNTANEFDGSDAGALPDEAISWGKLRKHALAIKLHADATLAFPLIAAASFALHKTTQKY